MPPKAWPAIGTIGTAIVVLTAQVAQAVEAFHDQERFDETWRSLDTDEMWDTEDEMSTLQTSRVDALLLQAANTTNTSAHAGYFQQLSADVAKEGVFHYFSTRLAFWIGLVTSIVVMSLLNICLCPTSGDQMIDETFGDVAEAWVPIHKAPKFVGSPLQSPYFGTSPYHAAGYAPGSPDSPTSHQTSFSPTSSP